MSVAPLLAATGLVARLGRREVLHGCDLALRAGEFVVVAGPNGAGKSTLLRCLAGLVAPQAGEVTFGGRPLASLSRTGRACAIAYLPQHGSVAWPMTVADLVMLGRLPHGATREAHAPTDREAVEAAIAAVDLAGFALRDVTRLSGGERSRALLARALATRAPVLLCDEPLTALDPAHQLLVLDLLREEARRGVAVVAVMHDLAAAARHADRLVALHKGRIAADGAPADVLTPNLLEAVFGIRAVIEEREGGLLLLPWERAQNPSPALAGEGGREAAG
jgi:iron complex transport system ATP-binding protein